MFIIVKFKILEINHVQYFYKNHLLKKTTIKIMP